MARTVLQTDASRRSITGKERSVLSHHFLGTASGKYQRRERSMHAMRGEREVPSLFGHGSSEAMAVSGPAA